MLPACQNRQAKTNRDFPGAPLFQRLYSILIEPTRPYPSSEPAAAMRTRSLSLLVVLFLAVPAVQAQVPPDKVLPTFKVVDGLQLELFAAEPLFVNPTCMDIDHKGRVWVCESVNYRRKLHRPAARRRPEGDRIVILEDTKGDGQGRQVDRLLPVAGDPAPRSASPSPRTRSAPATRSSSASRRTSCVFEDKDGDGKADGPPKKLLSGFGGFDHDHGVHGILIGPDVKLYFSVGDQGVKDLQGVRRQGPQVDQQRHRLPGRHHLALRPRRQEPRTDRPQLPQRVRAVRR